ncbi:winged helix-turn-helix transcriptional regulator [Desulfovibrio inopinatus]|uniref:winged helix-turn-helix transcriptional regulator n=1 Tax=Desulfovibrio inopinatus TaxID=102109 RepID=UPI0003FE89B4|nr:winged helix-turn-helix transcriptional regulator [Desulfovibrio inopinatus]
MPDDTQEIATQSVIPGNYAVGGYNQEDSWCASNEQHVNMHALRTRYYAPSKDARVLGILDALSQDSEISQRDIARRLGISGALVNQHLHELASRHLLQFEALNGKSYRYSLTPDGERLRKEMEAIYATEAVHIYTALKSRIRKRLEYLVKKSLFRVVFFGASETCEVALSASANLPLKVIALVDSDPHKQGTLFHGYVLSPPQILETVACDAVLITSFGRQQEISEQLAPLCRATGVEMVSL